jgi:hypothetical protein
MKPKIIDFLLWPVALLLLYLVTHLSMTGIFYAFEFIVRLFSKLRFIFYILLIIPIISILHAIIYMVLITLYKLIIGVIVRQWKSLSLIFGILFTLEIIVFLILFWVGVIDFSWENLRFSTMNKIIFSILFLSLTIIPPTVYGSLGEDLEKV